MAEKNPTGGAAAVALRLPSHHISFLRGALGACREGVESDLRKGGERSPHRGRWEQEAATYGRLLDALKSRAVVADAEALRLLGGLAEATDTENDYEKALLEHRALCGLLGALEEAGR